MGAIWICLHPFREHHQARRLFHQEQDINDRIIVACGLVATAFIDDVLACLKPKADFRIWLQMVELVNMTSMTGHENLSRQGFDFD